jgi:hypothetical protein
MIFSVLGILLTLAFAIAVLWFLWAINPIYAIIIAVLMVANK